MAEISAIGNRQSADRRAADARGPTGVARRAIVRNLAGRSAVVLAPPLRGRGFSIGNLQSGNPVMAEQRSNGVMEKQSGGIGQLAKPFPDSRLLCHYPISRL